MKKKVLMALLIGSACLAAGCSKKAPETEKTTEAAVTEASVGETEAETKTESADETEAETAEEASDKETENGTETGSAEETEAESGAEADTEGGSDAESEPDSEAGSETESAIRELGERPEYNALDYVELGDYIGLNVVLEPIEIAEEDIDASINGEILVKGLEETEGTVEEGDIVNIDYEGKLDGVAFDGGTAAGYDLEIGSHSFIDGFEDGLIGVAAGDTVDLNLTFPEDYGSTDLAGKETVFTVTVNYIMPEVTDELAGKLSDGAFTTLEDYRQHIREQLQEDEAETQVYTDVMTQIYNTCTINDYPQELVDYCVTSMMNVYMQYVEMSDMDLAEWLEERYGMTEDEFMDIIVEQVKDSLQQELLLKAIAENEELVISEEEYEEGCVKYAEQLGYGADAVDQFKEDYDRAIIETSLMMDKVLDFVKDNAVIEEVQETEEETEGTSEAADAEGDTEAVETESEETSETDTEEVTEKSTEAVSEETTEAE